MNQPPVKIRVLNRYRGEESHLFKDGAVPEGAVLLVTPQRARELIANGNGAPVLSAGPSETKPTGPAEKKLTGGTAGPAEPPSSLPAAPASPAPTAPKSLAARMLRAGEQLLSKTTTGSSPGPTSSTGATRTSGTRSARTGGRTSRS